MLLLRDPGREGGREGGRTVPSFGRGPLTLDMIKDLERMDADGRANGRGAQMGQKSSLPLSPPAPIRAAKREAGRHCKVSGEK